MDPLSVVTAPSRLRPDHAGGDVLHAVLFGDRSNVHKVNMVKQIALKTYAEGRSISKNKIIKHP